MKEQNKNKSNSRKIEKVKIEEKKDKNHHAASGIHLDIPVSPKKDQHHTQNHIKVQGLS